MWGVDTVRSKEFYEQEAAEYGVDVISYRGDSGVYKCKALKKNINKR